MSVVEVREPTPELVGSVSACTGKYGPEICFALGRKHDRWYIEIGKALFNAAGVEQQAIYVDGSRQDAERLVRLLAALYDKTPHGDDQDDDNGCEGHESLDGAHMGESVYCDGSCR